MIESKYLIFFVGSLVCVPLGIIAAVTSRRALDFVFIALVVGTTQTASFLGLPTDINFYSREWYRGTTTGIEISYLDLLALILLISSLAVRKREGRPFFWPPGLAPLLLFFLWCALNVAAFSSPKLFGVFELVKVFRGILLYMATAAYIRSIREVYIFVWALMAAIGYEAAYCLRDRYLYSFHRIRGTMPHPNSLSMYSLQCVPLFLAAFFATDATKNGRIAAFLAYCAAAGCVILSISRTGFAVLIILSFASFVLFTGLRLTPRNVALALLGCSLFLFMVVKSYDTIMGRLSGFSFRQEYFTEEGDRGSYFVQAAPAIRSAPLTGIGLNNWSYWITNRFAPLAGYDTMYELPLTPYPGTDERPTSDRQFPPAHNLYLLTITELGPLGLLFLLIVFARWCMISGSAFFTSHTTLSGTMRLGAFLSLAGVILQSWTEWEFRQTSLFFLAHVIMAMAAVLYINRPVRYIT